MKNKKYIVVSNFDEFKKINNYYKFDGSVLNDNFDEIIYDNLESAINYVDNYKLDSHSDSGSIYSECLYIYEYDEENEEPLENSNSLYDYITTEEELKNKFNIKIER